MLPLGAEAKICRNPSAASMNAAAQVHPLYLEVKGLVCCKLANLIGDLWLALLLASIFAVATAAAVFAFVAQLDALPQRGWVSLPSRHCDACFSLDGMTLMCTAQDHEHRNQHDLRADLGGLLSPSFLLERHCIACCRPVDDISSRPRGIGLSATFPIYIQDTAGITTVCFACRCCGCAMQSAKEFIDLPSTLPGWPGSGKGGGGGFAPWRAGASKRQQKR